MRALNSRAHDHREDARDIGLESQRLQIEHQLDVFVERGRNIGGTLRQLNRLDSARFHALNALLDFANRLQIFGQLGPIARAQRLVEAAHFLHHRIEDAAVALHPRHALRRASAIAEQAFKHYARMSFGRIRAWSDCARKWCC